jgi:hypothetical protein
MVSRRWGQLVAVVLLLGTSATGCAAAPSSPSDTNVAEVSPESTGSPSSIAPESNVAESPQQHTKKAIAIKIAGPPNDGTGGDYSVDNPDGCAVFHINATLDEDVRVMKTSVEPGDAFTNAGKGCGGDPTSNCVGYVFAKGADHTCLLDVRWDPSSGTTSGTATIFLRAVCHDRADAMCSQLSADPPAAGTMVRFHLTQQLNADPGDTTDGDDTTGDSPTPDDSPTS